MFRAIHIKGNREITSIDPMWDKNLSNLRKISRSGDIVCPGCKQPVVVKAGMIRIRHFAHREKSNCHYHSGSSALLSARAILYEYLCGKFGNIVTIEKEFEKDENLRPIDCFVESADTKIAYWIFDKNVRPEKRYKIRSAIQRKTPNIVWIFLSSFIRGNMENEIQLSTTERSFLKKTQYDISRKGYRIGYTLHFLDPKKEQLLTYRLLRNTHGPQIYHGVLRRNRISEVLVLRITGEFVHPGEHEEYEKIEERKEEKRKRDKELIVEREREKGSSNIEFKTLIDIEANETDVDKIDDKLEFDEKSIEFIDKIKIEKTICEFCGKEKEFSEWWSRNGKKNTCKCNDCARKGVYSQADVEK